MILIFSAHARERIKERGIKQKDVKQCLLASVVVSPTGENIAVKRLNGKVLVVVFRKTGDIYFVITAFASSKSEKYLKTSIS